MGDKVLIAAIDGVQRGLAVWRLKSVVDGSNVSPHYLTMAVLSSYSNSTARKKDTTFACLSLCRAGRRSPAKPVGEARAPGSPHPAVGRCARQSHSHDKSRRES
jgi:hypothetical protein